MEDLIFIQPQVICPKCSKFIDTSIEGLDDNEELTCSRCTFVFTPNINADKFVKLVKKVEDGGKLNERSK